VGVQASPKEARRWLTAAARQGHAGAMVLLGGLLLQFAPDATDRAHAEEQARAAELFRRAASKGNIDAQYNLGVCLRRGIGVLRDDAKAELLYTAAAEHGHVSAQLALGTLKAQNATKEADWEDVAYWYRQASDAGHPAAMASLADLYETGRGTVRDRSAALALHRQALAAGHEESGAAIKRIESELKRRELVR
jgi:TPR repeat protein